MKSSSPENGRSRRPKRLRGGVPGRLRRAGPLVYALAAAGVCLSLASFAPREGLPLLLYFPLDTSLALRIRNGAKFVRRLGRAEEAAELRARLLQLPLPADAGKKRPPAAPAAGRARTLQEAPAALREKVPRLLRPFFPELRYAFSGECALVLPAEPPVEIPPPPPPPAQTRRFALLSPAAESGSSQPAAEPGKTLDRAAKKKPSPRAAKKKRRPPFRAVLFLRLRGGAGTAVRMVAALYSRARKKRTRLYDLGNGVLAVGFGGARPRQYAGAGKPAAASFGPAVPSVLPMPPAVPSEAGERVSAVVNLWPRARDWTGALRLQKPATLGLCLPEITDRPDNTGENTPGAPGKVRTSPDGLCFILRGVWGGKPPAPQLPEPFLAGKFPERAPPLLEARLPFDAGAAFDAYLSAQFRAGRKGARRWRARLAQLRAAGVDLHRDLWAKTGREAALQIMPPLRDSLSGLPVARISLPFLAPVSATAPSPTVAATDLKKPATVRDAAAALIRARWKRTGEGRPKKEPKRPYARLFRRREEDRWLLRLSGFSCALLCVRKKGASFISEAGVKAFFQAEDPQPWPRTEPFARNGKEDYSDVPVLVAPYFLRFSGKRLTPLVETLVRAHLDKLRKDMGAAEFERLHLDPEAFLRVARAAAGFLGEFSLRLYPDGRLQGKWRLKGRDTKLTE